MPWWGWVLIVAGALTAFAVVFRRQLRFAVKLAKALVTDERVPRPIRLAIGVSLAIKVVPFPDFGVDEVILFVVAVLLLTVYRSTLRAIVAELHSLPLSCSEAGTTRPEERREGVTGGH